MNWALFDHPPKTGEKKFLSEQGKIISFYARKYYYELGKHMSADFNDFKQMASLATLVAYRSFDPTRQVKIEGWTIQCIKWLIIREYTRNSWTKAKKQYNVEFYDDITPIEGVSFDDLLTDETEDLCSRYERANSIQQIFENLHALTKRERQTMLLRLKTGSQVGKWKQKKRPQGDWWPILKNMIPPQYQRELIGAKKEEIHNWYLKSGRDKLQKILCGED